MAMNGELDTFLPVQPQESVGAPWLLTLHLQVIEIALITDGWVTAGFIIMFH